MQLDDLFTLFILVVGGLSLLARKKRPAPQRGPVRDLEIEDELVEELDEGPNDPPAPGSVGELFRQIQIEQRRRTGLTPRRATVPLPSAEEVEDRETLEIVPVVKSRTPIVRAAPVVVDLDETGEEAVQRRLRSAAARNRALNAADHRAFDQRIRGPVPTTSRVKHGRRTAIQNAIVWKEILGTPVSMRDGGPLDY